jgi:hypothetical protein
VLVPSAALPCGGVAGGGALVGRGNGSPYGPRAGLQVVMSQRTY